MPSAEGAVAHFVLGGGRARPAPPLWRTVRGPRPLVPSRGRGLYVSGVTTLVAEDARETCLHGEPAPSVAQLMTARPLPAQHRIKT
jgi:hypothetical protein